MLCKQQDGAKMNEDYIPYEQSTFKEYEDIFLKREDTIQCKTYGTCRVISVTNDHIIIQNTQTKEQWQLLPEEWISKNWDLIATTPDTQEKNSALQTTGWG